MSKNRKQIQQQIYFNFKTEYEALPLPKNEFNIRDFQIKHINCILWKNGVSLGNDFYPSSSISILKRIQRGKAPVQELDRYNDIQIENKMDLEYQEE